MLRPDEIKSEIPASYSGCDVCGEQHETNDCPHLQNGKRVENARAPSRARLTLPANLRIKKLKDDDGFTVVARENISCGTRFGPFEAQVVYDSAPQTSFPLVIFEKTGGSYYVDTSNEEECNWMFFVVSAQTQSEQNLMAYQMNQDIYYSALRDIRIHEELRVWYAPHYAKKMAMEPPWPPDELGKSKDSPPAPEKVIRKRLTEESIEPAAKRGRKKKVYTDFVETPDLDDLEYDAALDVTTSSRDSPDAASPAFGEDQREWNCSQCGLSFQSCADFARHLRQHYDPRKSDESDGKQKRIVQTRPKKFGCQFCDAKFSSNKLLQRHRLRHHRRKSKRKEPISAPCDVVDEEPVAEELIKGKEKSRHISDTDAASILLEIEANFDKPEEGLVESHGCEEMSIPEIDYLVTGIGEIKGQELVEDISVEEHVAMGGTIMDVVEEDIIQETAFSQTDLDVDTKNDADVFNCDICNMAFDKRQDLYQHIGSHVEDQHCGKFSHKESASKHGGGEAASEDGGDSSDEDDSNVEHFCPFCQKSFAKSQLLRRHITKHTGEFTCHECGKSYCSKNILKSHVCSKKPEEKGRFICEICHKSFSKESYLERHIPVHTGAHACPNCGKWLRSNDSLNNHIRICWQVKELETNGSASCPHCKQVFTDTRSFRRHMYDHTHLFMCTNCGARFRNKVSEMQHLCDAERIVECEVCQEKFPNVAALNKHKSSHGEEKVKCNSCGMAFHRKDELSAHQCNDNDKKRSKKRNTGPLNLQPLICEFCGSLFSSTSSLNVHKRLHGKKLFSCDLCGKEFHRKDLMLDHCAVHGEAAIPCQMCSKMFKTKKSLDVHMLIHDGVKRFACTMCGKQFHQKGNLLKHEEVHNPERKYTCSYCSKMFSTKEYLAIHVLEHTRGRVHACDICDKSFVKEHQLKAHQRVFHTNMAYICAFCGLSVKLKHSLKRHLSKKHADQRGQWSGSDQIAAMLVNNEDRELEEEVGNDAENLQLVETVNQVQDGTEVLLAVAGIGEALQQALASGTARIQQGSLPNTIEISLPAENEMVDNAFVGGMMDEGDELQAQIIHLPMGNEMEGDGEIGEAVDVDEQLRVEDANNEDDAMSTQITVMSGEEPFPSTALTGNQTIVLDDGTFLRSGVSQDGTDLLYYVITTEEDPGGINDGETS